MIVIPMAGLSSRFSVAGYGLPKYMLPLRGGTVFDRAVRSFEALFATEAFLFVTLDVAGTPAFVADACAALEIARARVVSLDSATAGQAETVELGLERAEVADDASITIFNIDTFRADFGYPTAPWWVESAGYLEVFRGSGANWSYVRTDPDDGDRIVETAEKRPISDLCCTGLYHFTRAGDFRAALQAERRRPSAPELYVAPLYNHLIAGGRKVHKHEVPPDEIVFCGVPAEYEALLAAERSATEGGNGSGG